MSANGIRIFGADSMNRINYLEYDLAFWRAYIICLEWQRSNNKVKIEPMPDWLKDGFLVGGC